MAGGRAARSAGRAGMGPVGGGRARPGGGDRAVPPVPFPFAVAPRRGVRRLGGLRRPGAGPVSKGRFEPFGLPGGRRRPPGAGGDSRQRRGGV